MIFPKIKKFFKNSKYYQNYQNIDSVLDIYGNIKKKHTDYENQIKIELIEFIHEFIKCGVEESYLEEYISYLFEEFDFDFVYNIIEKFDETTVNTIYNLNSVKLFLDKNITDENFIYKNCTPEYFLINKNIDKSNLRNNERMQKFFKKCHSYSKIINEKLSAGDDIGNYVKYTESYNRNFIDKGLKEYINKEYFVNYLLDYVDGIKDVDKLIKIIKKFVKKGLDVNNKFLIKKCCEYGNTYIEILKFLYDNGCDIHYNNDILFIESLDTDTDTIEFFLERNVDMYAHDFKAIDYIVNNGCVTYLQLFIKHGLDIHFDNEYILMLCTETYEKNAYYKIDTYNLLKFLIDNNADIHCLNDKPLRLACMYRNFKNVKLLVENGANIAARDYEAIDHAIEYERKDILKYLLKNCKDTEDSYPLMIACKYGYLDIVELLIERGFDVHYHDDKGLVYASSKGYIDIVKLLVKNGANINANSDEPFMNAVRNGNYDVVKFLIKKRSDVYANIEKAIEISKKNDHLKLYNYLQKFNIKK